MEIRKFRDEDAEELSVMINRTIERTNSKDYTDEEIERLLMINTPEILKSDARDMSVYIAEENSKIVGTISLAYYVTHDQFDIERQFGEVRRNYVSPNHQGRGIGRQLYGALEKEATEQRMIFLEAGASLTAVDFYKKMGFRTESGVETSPEPLKTRYMRMVKDL